MANYLYLDLQLDCKRMFFFLWQISLIFVACPRPIEIYIIQGIDSRNKEQKNTTAKAFPEAFTDWYLFDYCQ